MPCFRLNRPFALSACHARGRRKHTSSPPTGPASPIPAPATTLQAETGNNTSAAEPFTQQTDGNLDAGNVEQTPAPKPALQWIGFCRSESGTEWVMLCLNAQSLRSLRGCCLNLVPVVP